MSNSIIIPAHNEAQTISRTLGSVLQSNLEDDFTELLVVGSACTDNTLDAATEYLDGKAPAWDYRCLEAVPELGSYPYYQLSNVQTAWISRKNLTPLNPPGAYEKLVHALR